MPEPIRLNKYLAQQLGFSRREADIWISQGKVKINGRLATLGNIIVPGKDNVQVENRLVDGVMKRFTYILMNKPVGYVCSRRQQDASPTIYSLLPHYLQNLKVAGRLDKDSQGLLLLTDNGDLIFKLTHPRFGKSKTYIVGINKPLNPADLKSIEKGIELEDGASQLKLRELPKSKLPNRYEVIMHEGRNRQIRRTFKALGYTVTHLERTKLGSYSLEQLKNKIYLQISN